uniref:Uncharacterized protein n=1 Tax=Lotharella globosa TaxID=91324 RepID=A0A7S3YVI2_9EUKA|mmetsp:Transcript_1403/g.2673  ORF Transcript_1403/g.2673 Transcript_1403/m.2673 type:complete len:256 (+) Transcript_1403:121-888(+)
MPRKKDSEETKQRRPGGGLGGFDEYEDSDPVYNLDTTIGKPTISTSIAKSPLSYHRTAKRYYKDRFDEKDPHLWKRDHTVCKRTEVDPYHTTNWSKSTMLSKDKTKAIDWRKKKINRGEWLHTSSPETLGHCTLKSSPKAVSPHKWGVSKTVALAEKVLRSPQKYSASFGGKRFADRVDTTEPKVGPGTYDINKSSMKVKESKKKSPAYRSGVSRFSAFGTSKNTKSYIKRKGWSKKHMQEHFRFHNSAASEVTM